MQQLFMYFSDDNDIGLGLIFTVDVPESLYKTVGYVDSAY